MLPRRGEGEGLEAPERAAGTALRTNPYPAPSGKFPQAAALGPKICQHPLLETEKYQPANGFPRSGLWKKGGLGDQGPPFCPEGRPLQRKKPASVRACVHVCVHALHVRMRAPPPGGSRPRD